MLQTKELTFSYDNKKVLHFPDLNCGKGDHWLLLGQSGSGKTTLLHLLAGLMKPKSGHINVEGTNIDELTSNKLDRFRGRHIGIVFQRSHFIKALSVQENLVVAQQFAGLPVNKSRIKELLQRLNIGHKLHSKTDRLSQGEQQRLAIARALINKPDVILADEPTSALDDVNCTDVLRLIEEQASQEKATLLIVTHDNRLKDRFDLKIHLQPQ